MHPSLDREIERAAEAIADADALFIGAGAGMGVDSGLPDFRGREGFWNAYPPYAKLGLDFVELASPGWFDRDPELAWGFYGHRLELYRATAPHPGFEILRRWAGCMPRGAFVFTSNVDGHFQRAGFDPIAVYEVHGTIGAMQCLAECGVGVFPADPFRVVIDESTMRAVPPLPACPKCGGPTRPNILMFGDMGWDRSKAEPQWRNWRNWLEGVAGRRVVVVECGAGKAVPTVRRTCEEVAGSLDATLVRINVREPDGPRGSIGLPLGALDALRRIDALFRPRCAGGP